MTGKTGRKKKKEQNPDEEVCLLITWNKKLVDSSWYTPWFSRIEYSGWVGRDIPPNKTIAKGPRQLLMDRITGWDKQVLKWEELDREPE